MRLTLRILPVVLLFGCAGLRPKPTAPALTPNFTSKSGGYKVAFPKPPEESVEDAERGLRSHLAMAVQDEPRVVYMVTYTDWFEESRLARDTIFASEMEGMVEGRKEMWTRKQKFFGEEGRAFHVVQEDGVHIHGRMFFRDTRLFILFVMGAEELAEPAAEPFFGSFSYEGEGKRVAPKDPKAKRVQLPEARVSVEMHGEPVRSPVSDGFQLAATLRGGLRHELITFVPVKVEKGTESQALNGLVDGFRSASSGLRDLRTIHVNGKEMREFEMKLGERTSLARVMLVDGGALALQLVGPEGTVKAEDAQAYFATLKHTRGSKK